MAPNDAYVQKFRQAQERVSRKSPASSSDGTTKRVSIDSADSTWRERPATKGNSTQSSDWWRTKLINAPDLCDLQFADLKYVVPGIIPEGVTLLASRPKLGKSWLFLQVGSAVATGVTALVPSEKPLHGDVLYLALEDNPRRLQRRLKKYFGPDRSTWPARLTIVTEWKQLDQGGLEATKNGVSQSANRR